MIENNNDLTKSSTPAKQEAVDKKDAPHIGKPDAEHRDILLSHKEAEAGSPADVAACGEEDSGSGLEFLVEENPHNDEKLHDSTHDNK